MNSSAPATGVDPTSPAVVLQALEASLLKTFEVSLRGAAHLYMPGMHALWFDHTPILSVFSLISHRLAEPQGSRTPTVVSPATSNPSIMSDFERTMDTFNTITSIHVCYYYLVAKRLDSSALLSGVWSLRLEIAETGAVILVSHIFYARRLYLLGNHRFFPVGLIAILLVIETGFAIAATYESFVQVTFANFRNFTWMNWGVLGAGLVVDMVASSVLIFYLRRSRTGWKRSDSILDIMMVYAVNTGLCTGIITAASLLTSILAPDTLVYAAITVIGNKMYANALLAVLNSRRSLLDKGREGFETGSFGLQVLHPRVTTLNQLPHVSPLDPHIEVRKKDDKPIDMTIDIKVTTETFMDGPAFCPQEADDASGNE